MQCTICDDVGWVCENHLDRPWEGPRACGCGGAGALCPRCNVSAGDEPPRMPAGFRAETEGAGQQPSPAETIDRSYGLAILAISEYLEQRIDTKAAVDRLIAILDNDDLREAITEIMVDAKVHPRSN